MKKWLKIVCLFFLFLGFYFLPALLFPTNTGYYNSIHKPFYAPNALLFGIAWPILYVIFSLYLSIKIINKTISKSQIIYLIVNYSISFFFNKVFFIEKELFLSFVVTFLSFITGIFILLEALKQNKKQGLLFTPYFLWTLFASILMMHIYFIN